MLLLLLLLLDDRRLSCYNVCFGFVMSSGEYINFYTDFVMTCDEHSLPST